MFGIRFLVSYIYHGHDELWHELSLNVILHSVSSNCVYDFNYFIGTYFRLNQNSVPSVPFYISSDAAASGSLPYVLADSVSVYFASGTRDTNCVAQLLNSRAGI